MKNKLFKTFFATSLIFFAINSSAMASETGFNFTYKEQKFEVTSETLQTWKGQQILTTSKILKPAPESLKSSLLRYTGQQPKTNPSKNYNYKISSIYKFLQTLQPKVDTQTVEPELLIENNQVTKFTPPQEGLKIELYKTALNTLTSLDQGKTNLEISIHSSPPQKNLTETNNLGINELIATGISSFSGSPNNRRHNIAIGVKKFTGIIIPKDTEFSFNKILGPVEAEQGFLPELVIKKTGTVPEFGGGLCQVSSTTFRAAMEAGLPITQRRNHAYAVQYYAPQGTDATIYPGVIDLKFINDTPGAILVWPYFKDKNTLVFDFYGTKDNRQVTLEKPVQYDRKPDGSMKATWTRTITKNGENKSEDFKSTYQPPALFHKTEQFVTATTSPTSVQ